MKKLCSMRKKTGNSSLSLLFPPSCKKNVDIFRPFGPCSQCMISGLPFFICQFVHYAKEKAVLCNDSKSPEQDDTKIFIKLPNLNTVMSPCMGF